LLEIIEVSVFGSLLTPWIQTPRFAAKIVDEGADYCLAVKGINPNASTQGDQGIFP